MNIFLLKILLKIKYFFLKVITVFFFKNDEVINPKVIMAYRSCLLGDFIFAIPALNILRTKYPNAKLIFLTSAAGSKDTMDSGRKYVNINKLFPWFDLITPEIINETISIQKISIKEIKGIKKKIKDYNPDLFFLLPHPGDPLKGLLKKIFLFKILGVRKNFFGWKVKGDYSYFREQQQGLGYFGHKIFGPIRAIEEYESIGKVNQNQIKFPITVKKKYDLWAKNIVIKDTSNKLMIGISPGGIREHKIWPIDKYIEVVKNLDSEFEISFFLIGTKNDIEISKQFKKLDLKNKMIDLVGKTDINQLAALFSKLDLVVTNDGGGAHLSAAMGCKVITIISGIEYPHAIDPWGNFKYSVRLNTSCSPCYSMTFCPLIHMNCLRKLETKSVMEKVYLAINDL